MLLFFDAVWNASGLNAHVSVFKLHYQIIEDYLSNCTALIAQFSDVAHFDLCLKGCFDGH